MDDKRLYWAGKTRLLYYSNCGQAWGDGMQNLRILRAARNHYPDTLIDYADHIQTGEAAAPMLVYEGIVDAVSLIPEQILSGSHAHFRNFTEQRVGTVPYDVVIFGWATASPELVLGIIRETNPSMQWTSIEGSKSLYESMKGYCAPEALFPNYYNPAIAAVGTSIAAFVQRVLSVAKNPQSLVAVIPFSSRPHSRIQPTAFAMILESLLAFDYTPLLIGSDRATWVLDVNVRRAWKSHAEAIEAVAKQYPVIDCFGVSAPKQYELLKHCKMAIYSQTGAIILPSLANTHSIPLSCGDTSVITDILKMDNKPHTDVRTRCDRFPCNAANRRSDCVDTPMCLAEEFPVEELQHALKTIKFGLPR